MATASACFSLYISTIRENSVSKKDLFSPSDNISKFGSPTAITFKFVCSILCPRIVFGLSVNFKLASFLRFWKCFRKKRKIFCTGKPLLSKYNRYSKTQIGRFFSCLKIFLPIFALRLYHTDFWDTTDFIGRFVPSQWSFGKCSDKSGIIPIPI